MAKKTDNSFFREKVKLRIENLPTGDPINVLDVFHGTGLIWDEVIRATGRKIFVLGIEKKKGLPQIYLQGDNRKYQIDYDRFDLIDLDCYGVPYQQLEKIFQSATRQIGIFVTFIQSQFGRLPVGLLGALGYSRAMVKKTPVLYNNNGQQKMLNYLALRGVNGAKIYQTENKRKNYIFFKLLPKK